MEPAQGDGFLANGEAQAHGAQPDVPNGAPTARMSKRKRYKERLRKWKERQTLRPAGTALQGAPAGGQVRGPSHQGQVHGVAGPGAPAPGRGAREEDQEQRSGLKRTAEGPACPAQQLASDPACPAELIALDQGGPGLGTDSNAADGAPNGVLWAQEDHLGGGNAHLKRLRQSAGGGTGAGSPGCAPGPAVHEMNPPASGASVHLVKQEGASWNGEGRDNDGQDGPAHPAEGGAPGEHWRRAELRGAHGTPSISGGAQGTHLEQQAQGQQQQQQSQGEQEQQVQGRPQQKVKERQGQQAHGGQQQWEAEQDKQQQQNRWKAWPASLPSSLESPRGGRSLLGPAKSYLPPLRHERGGGAHLSGAAGSHAGRQAAEAGQELQLASHCSTLFDQLQRTMAQRLRALEEGEQLMVQRTREIEKKTRQSEDAERRAAAAKAAADLALASSAAAHRQMKEAAEIRSRAEQMGLDLSLQLAELRRKEQGLKDKEARLGRWQAELEAREAASAACDHCNAGRRQGSTRGAPGASPAPCEALAPSSAADPLDSSALLAPTAPSAVPAPGGPVKAEPDPEDEREQRLKQSLDRAHGPGPDPANDGPGPECCGTPRDDPDGILDEYVAADSLDSLGTGQEQPLANSAPPSTGLDKPGQGGQAAADMMDPSRPSLHPEAPQDRAASWASKSTFGLETGEGQCFPSLAWPCSQDGDQAEEDGCGGWAPGVPMQGGRVKVEDSGCGQGEPAWEDEVLRPSDTRQAPAAALASGIQGTGSGVHSPDARLQSQGMGHCSGMSEGVASAARLNQDTPTPASSSCGEAEPGGGRGSHGLQDAPAGGRAAGQPSEVGQGPHAAVQTSGGVPPAHPRTKSVESVRRRRVESLLARDAPDLLKVLLQSGVLAGLGALDDCIVDFDNDAAALSWGEPPGAPQRAGRQGQGQGAAADGARCPGSVAWMQSSALLRLRDILCKDRMPSMGPGAGAAGPPGTVRPMFWIHNLAALVQQGAAVQKLGWPVSWGWCASLRCFLFVFHRHNRIILETPEYGKATYFFEIEAGRPLAWQLQRLLAVMAATAVGRADVLQNRPLKVGQDLTEEEAQCLAQFGWRPGLGLGALLNFVDRLYHESHLLSADTERSGAAGSNGKCAGSTNGLAAKEGCVKQEMDVESNGGEGATFLDGRGKSLDKWKQKIGERLRKGAEEGRCLRRF